jgi:hypothetical protein
MTRETRRGNPALSIRLTQEERDHLREKSSLLGTTESGYLHALLQADMGKRQRRPGRQHVVLREGLARIHAALIVLGNQSVSEQSDIGATRLVERGLADVVAALLRLEDTVRGE